MVMRIIKMIRMIQSYLKDVKVMPFPSGHLNLKARTDWSLGDYMEVSYPTLSGWGGQNFNLYVKKGSRSV